MSPLYPLIDVVILLFVPVATLMERLAARPSGGYGHATEARQKVTELISTVEPLLRKLADHEIDTRQPVGATVDQILRLV